MTCSVTGTLVDPTGAALPDTPYRLARAGGIVGTGAGTVVPKIITGVSGTAAEFDEDLVAGNYLLTVYPATGQTYSVALPVPDEASAALSDLVTGVDAPQVAVWLTEARAAAAAAETAASAAEASAAAIQPYDSRADAIAALPDLADTITRVSWREGNAILSSVRQTGATEFAAGWAMARRENTFSLGDYLHEDDLSAALAGDLAGQDIDRVTAAVQAFHHAVFSYFDAVATTYSQVIVEYLPGLIAINDEMFSEATAQIIWDLGYKNQLAAITFDFKSLYVACDFGAYSAVRTSGYYDEHSITYAVPKVAFRLMRSAISPANLAVFRGRLQIVGSNDFATDPVGVMLYNINGLTSDAEILARNLVQSGFVVESIFNSRLSNFRSNSGFVATEYGGDYGLIPKTATFSSAGTTLTASEAVFDASHVGAWVWLSGAGPLNSDGGTYMPHGTTIAAYVSPTEVTLTDAPDRDVTGKRLSFEGITGTVADGGSTITMSKALTDDELTMLRELHDAMLKPHGGKPPLIDQMQELRAALLDVPVGAGPEARPLLTRINAVVQLHERASWAMRATVWLVSALGAISGGVLAVRGLWR